MKWGLFLLVLFPGILWSQYHFNFEGGKADVTGKDPAWQMEQVPRERWEWDTTNPLRGAVSLRHSYDNPVAGCDYFMIHHLPFVEGDSLSLSFRVRHSYNPSAANNWQVALLADFAADDRGSGEIVNGIVVGVNYRGSDDLMKIWRIDKGAVHALCTTSYAYQEEVGTEAATQFKLSWHRDGALTLFQKRDAPGSLLTQIGSCQSVALPEGRALVIRYNYSAAQDRKLWIDEIKLNGHFVADTIPPGIIGWDIQGESCINLHFSERIESLSTEAFSLCPVDVSGVGSPEVCLQPDSISADESDLQLCFSHAFPNREILALLVRNLCDEEGNCLPDTMLKFMRNDPEWGDVVINEVMADPEPGTRESLGEYIELFNNADDFVFMNGWTLRVGEREFDLGDASPVIAPGGYFLIYDISLPNKGAALALYTKDGMPVHAATYRNPIEGPVWKLEGGWSLEATDPSMACNTSELWLFSTDPDGGTPGEINSVDAQLEDLEAPLYLYHGFGDTGSVFVQYSEPVHFIGDPNKAVRIHPGSLYPDSVVRSTPLGMRFTAYFAEGILDRSMFRLELPELYDCQGNRSGSVEIETGKVARPGAGDVVINELMYNPEEGSPEYIELFNPSSRCYDLQDLAVDVVDPGAGPKHFSFLSDHSRIMGPGEYVVVTRDIRFLMAAYGLENSGDWVEVEDLKSLPGHGAWIYLADRSGSTIDRVEFDDQLHMEGIDDTRGISLERIAWDRSGINPENWHSAASIAGYATPGKPNSQRDPDFLFLDILEVEPKVFSPDNDGYQDLLGIVLGTLVQGSVIRLWITDMSGNPVRELANNHIAGPASRYTWNGEDDDSSLVMEGIYVIHLKGYHPVSGRVWNSKCAAGVVYR